MKYLFFIFSLYLSVVSYGQESKTEENFIADFTKALDNKFTSESLYKMLDVYSWLLNAHSIVAPTSEKIKGHPFTIYPLNNFKSEKLYSENIHDLLNSENENQRMLAYVVIASSCDTSKENILLKVLKTEKEKYNLLRACISLTYLNSNHTTEIFECLLKNEDLGDSHIFPMFMLLNNDSLQQTAYNKILSTDNNTKIMAAQILSKTPPNITTESLLKQAIINWDINIKAYAIFPVKELQIGNLLEILKPLLDSPQTRSIALEALANSPTTSDKNYLFKLITNQDSIKSDLLDCLYNSKSIDNLKFWLKILYTKKIKQGYDFFVFQQPLIRSDKILIDLQTALQKIKDKHILAEMVRALEGRTDDKSIEILVNFLEHKNSTIRYWTAKILKNNSSKKLTEPKIKKLIARGLNDGNNPED